jgi:NADPH:quinone reductase-like Zn-dependent oxidoreductase
LLDSGEIHSFVDTVVPFDKASDAYCATIENRTGRGKLVLSLTL